MSVQYDKMTSKSMFKSDRGVRHPHVNSEIDDRAINKSTHMIKLNLKELKSVESRLSRR